MQWVDFSSTKSHVINCLQCWVISRPFKCVCAASFQIHLSITNGFSWKPESGVSSAYSFQQFSVSGSYHGKFISNECGRHMCKTNIIFSCWWFLEEEKIPSSLPCPLLAPCTLSVGSNNLRQKKMLLFPLISSIVFFSYLRPCCRMWR